MDLLLSTPAENACMVLEVFGRCSVLGRLNLKKYVRLKALPNVSRLGEVNETNECQSYLEKYVQLYTSR